MKDIRRTIGSVAEAIGKWRCNSVDMPEFLILSQREFDEIAFSIRSIVLDPDALGAAPTYSPGMLLMGVPVVIRERSVSL